MIGNVVLELSLNPALTVGLVVLESDDNGVIDGVVDDDCIDEPVLASVLLFSKSPDLVCWLFSIRVIFSGKSFSNKRCSTPLHSTPHLLLHSTLHFVPLIVMVSAVNNEWCEESVADHP